MRAALTILFHCSFFQRFKENVGTAAKDLFSLDSQDKDINKPIYAPRDEFGTGAKKEGGPEEQPEQAEDEHETVGGGAVMVVKQQKGTWEKITSRLRESPLIQEILGAAGEVGRNIVSSHGFQSILTRCPHPSQVADTDTGRTLGAGAKAARDRVSDRVEDAREFWETSQNPCVV